jgi:hypothetical protein
MAPRIGDVVAIDDVGNIDGAQPGIVCGYMRRAIASMENRHLIFFIECQFSIMRNLNPCCTRVIINPGFAY